MEEKNEKDMYRSWVEVVTRFDKDGYDKDGYDKYGYNDHGYNKEGEDKDGYYLDGYKYIDGYNERGFDKNGIHKNGTKYGDDVYDMNDTDISGYDRDGECIFCCNVYCDCNSDY